MVCFLELLYGTTTLYQFSNDRENERYKVYEFNAFVIVMHDLIQRYPLLYLIYYGLLIFVLCALKYAPLFNLKKKKLINSNL